MPKLPRMIPVSELRQEAAAVLDGIRTEGGPVVITQRGRAAAVLVSVDQYERGEHELELLRALALGERELQAGLGHGLDEVLADADELLARTA